jgi:hypothetical protein
VQSGFTLATPTETAFAGQTSCVSDILYTASDFTATVCGTAGTDPSLTTFMSEPSLAVVWAKRILVVPETTEEESSSSSRVRSTRTASERETSTAEESAVGTPIETSEETATGAGGVTSRLPSVSPTAAAAGGRLSVIGGLAGVVVGVVAVMLVVV